MNNDIKSARKISIVEFYRRLLSREPTEEELAYYVNSDDPLEMVYINVKMISNSLKEGTNKLPISLVIFTKDAEDSIELPIKSVIDYVSEIVIVDTGSSDATMDICKEYTDRVYRVGFSDFGSIRTAAAHLARQPWVLGLDSDEVLTNPSGLNNLIADPEIDAWGIARRRWVDLSMKTQVEVEAYPDTQWRLFRNNTKFVYSGRVHESFEGCKNKKTTDSIHIEHFQDVFKSGEKLAKRNSWYKELYELDLLDGRRVNIFPVSTLDEV